MEQSMTAFIPFANIFLVPMVTFYIHYKRQKKDFSFSMKAVLQYGIMVLVNLLITKILFMGVRLLTGRDINHDAVTYTMLALVVAILLPYIYSIWRRMCKEGENAVK